MLILTRKTGQTIVVGDDIKITVTEVNGNHVKLGIDAPKDIVVNRQEVHDRMQTEMMIDKEVAV